MIIVPVQSGIGSHLCKLTTRWPRPVSCACTQTVAPSVPELAVSGKPAIPSPGPALSTATRTTIFVYATSDTNTSTQAFAPSVVVLAVSGKSAIASPGPTLPTTTRTTGVVETAFVASWQKNLESA